MQTVIVFLLFAAAVCLLVHHIRESTTVKDDPADDYGSDLDDIPPGERTPTEPGQRDSR